MAFEVTQLPVIGLGVIALVALLIGLILTRLGLPSSLGYIVAGMLLGPLALGFLAPGDGVTQLFGEIGVLMLLFYLGLELSIERFRQNGAIALALVSVEFVVAFVAGFAVSKFFGFSDLESIVVGGMLPFASTVIVVKFLMEKKIIDWPESRVAISSLIIEDFAAILVLVFLTSLSSAKSFNLLVVNGLLFVVAMFFVVRKFSKYALRLLRNSGHEDKMALYAVGVGIVVGYLGQVLDLSSALGAYFAGFALAETDYAERIKRELGLFREFFILFFFVSFGATIVFPTALNLYFLLALLLVAYVVSKVIAYGVFGSAIGLNPKSAITIGALMLPIGEFSIIIASAAAPLIGGPHASEILALAFLLTMTTGVAAPLLFRRIDSVTDIFLCLYPASVRRTLSVLGREVHALERILKSMEGEFWTSTRNLLFNFIIALSVVYVAAILNARIILPAFPNLPSSATLAFLILPFIVWPIYRTLQELRFLTGLMVSRFVHPHLVEKASEALVGLLLTLSSAFAASWLLGQKVPPLFLLLPLIYLVLAIIFLSQAMGSFFEKLDSLREAAISSRVTNPAVVKLVRRFDRQGDVVIRLNELRERAKNQIEEALSVRETRKARHLLTEFRKKEAVLLAEMRRDGSRDGAIHPFKEKARHPHLERYFVGRLHKKKR